MWKGADCNRINSFRRQPVHRELTAELRLYGIGRKNEIDFQFISIDGDYFEHELDENNLLKGQIYLFHVREPFNPYRRYSALAINKKRHGAEDKNIGQKLPM